jgi:hypothetical protein
MDISIAWLALSACASSSDRSLTAELQPGQTAATRCIVTLPPEARATNVLVERGGGAPLRCLIIGGHGWLPAPPRPPMVIAQQTAHRDTT